MTLLVVAGAAPGGSDELGVCMGIGGIVEDALGDVVDDALMVAAPQALSVIRTRLPLAHRIRRPASLDVMFNLLKCLTRTINRNAAGYMSPYRATPIAEESTRTER
jgi:hypothetical protein